MNAPELTRYTPLETPDGLFGNVDMAENDFGEYVRFADVEAYTQAAIAAETEEKDAQIRDMALALRPTTNPMLYKYGHETCCCGIDNPTDVCMSHYDVIEAIVRKRIQAAIAAAMVGAACAT